MPCERITGDQKRNRMVTEPHTIRRADSDLIRLGRKFYFHALNPQDQHAV
jgi:hypothetical protein